MKYTTYIFKNLSLLCLRVSIVNHMEKVSDTILMYQLETTSWNAGVKGWCVMIFKMKPHQKAIGT